MSFVKVCAVREQPFHSIEMIIPADRLESELPLFAAIVPPTYTWTAKPVGDISLRSEGVLVPETAKDTQ